MPKVYSLRHHLANWHPRSALSRDRDREAERDLRCIRPLLCTAITAAAFASHCTLSPCLRVLPAIAQMQHGVQPLLGIRRQVLVAISPVEHDGFAQRVYHHPAVTALG